jgi:ribosomal protein S18 acetylase RimI-like enzyme
VPPYAIRDGRREDLDAIIDHLERVAAERRWISSEPPLDRVRAHDSFERSIDDEHSLLLVAESAGRVIGELSATGRPKRPADIGMSVDSEWRGRGVGTALMHRCVEWARERDVHKLALHVWPHNDAALRLYEKFGFEREGLLRAHYVRENGERWDVVVMGLVLT